MVKVGDTVDAVVLSAGFHAVMVNVKGVDTFIQQFQLTHRYVKIVKDMYSTGMTIPVVIKNITYDEKGNYAFVLCLKELPKNHLFQTCHHQTV